MRRNFLTVLVAWAILTAALFCGLIYAANFNWHRVDGVVVALLCLCSLVVAIAIVVAVEHDLSDLQKRADDLEDLRRKAIRDLDYELQALKVENQKYRELRLQLELNVRASLKKFALTVTEAHNIRHPDLNGDLSAHRFHILDGMACLFRGLNNVDFNGGQLCHQVSDWVENKLKNSELKLDGKPESEWEAELVRYAHTGSVYVKEAKNAAGVSVKVTADPTNEE